MDDDLGKVADSLVNAGVVIGKIGFAGPFVYQSNNNKARQGNAGLFFRERCSEERILEAIATLKEYHLVEKAEELQTSYEQVKRWTQGDFS